jgi:hypothetical protein
MILLFDNKVFSVATKVINWPPGSGSVIQDPEEIFTDPQHCRNLCANVLYFQNIFLENGRAIISDFGLVNVARRLCSRHKRPGVTGTHGPDIYKDTKPQMSSLLVFNRVYRLEIQSVMLVFSTPLVQYGSSVP